MKNIAIYFVLGLGVIFFVSSCSDSPTCIRASSNIISETRNLKDFKGVVFSNVGDLILTQGPEYSFKIEGPDNVVELTKTKVENELLIIGSEDCFNGAYEVKIEITAPEYEQITFSGVGSITTVGQIDSGIIEVELIGIGDIEAAILADTLYTTIAGTGNVSYSGNVIRHQLSCSGDFGLNSYSLVTDHTSINLTGIGDSYVTANKTLNVVIEGVGDVYYKGNPLVTSEISGSGTIIDSN
ncbi:MAG: DUF2807 domain-containing protein [Cyclobacteriaceae bacterium]|nr:DUF2807 domain-containing protein [Cyclobacteriaceae bacterium]